MQRISKETVEVWRKTATEYLAKNCNLTPQSISTGRGAWTIAHNCGITREAYNDRAITDGHIQTALEAIFPNAVFRDKKVY